MTLQCCCCGGGAKALKQWWNRDHGYGICAACIHWLRTRPDWTAQEELSNYGREGIHFILEETDGSKR